MSSELVIVNVEWGVECSISEESDLMRRHSPTNPITDGSPDSASDLEGGRRTLRLPFT